MALAPSPPASSRLPSSVPADHRAHRRQASAPRSRYYVVAPATAKWLFTHSAAPYAKRPQFHRRIVRVAATAPSIREVCHVEVRTQVEELRYPKPVIPRAELYQNASVCYRPSGVRTPAQLSRTCM